MGQRKASSKQSFYMTNCDNGQRAILVGIDRMNATLNMKASIEELTQLANTAQIDVVAITSQKLTTPNPRTLVGSGKVEEIASLIRTYAADMVIFDDELTPSQQVNLEKRFNKSAEVIDRCALILDIFALHATTKEGKLQVQLAKNKYLYSHLRGMWAHLESNRMGGGVGSRFGEGESQLENDRRMVQKRITTIKRELAHLSKVRSVQRENRYESGIFKVSLAGYTNAGKSSLMNCLVNADVLSYDKLFATLDSTTRKLRLPEGKNITLTDTVGFIQKLPTTLVEAFKSTLDEITGSDLILHVIDATATDIEAQRTTVENTLEQIGAQSIPRIDVFNKVDLLSNEEMNSISQRYPFAQIISARTSYGIDQLIARLVSAASANDETIEVFIPFDQGKLVSLAHDSCRIISQVYEYDGVRIQMDVPQNLLNKFAEYSAAD